MATLRISLDRKTGKVINKQYIDNGTKPPDMKVFYNDFVDCIIEAKGGLERFLEEVQAFTTIERETKGA